jgi:hypothetical protein
MQRIIMIARLANNRGANQFITATFTLHDFTWRCGTDFSLFRSWLSRLLKIAAIVAKANVQGKKSHSQAGSEL